MICFHAANRVWPQARPIHPANSRVFCRSFHAAWANPPRPRVLRALMQTRWNSSPAGFLLLASHDRSSVASPRYGKQRVGRTLWLLCCAGPILHGSARFISARLRPREQKGAARFRRRPLLLGPIIQRQLLSNSAARPWHLSRMPPSSGRAVSRSRRACENLARMRTRAAFSKSFGI